MCAEGKLGHEGQPAAAARPHGPVRVGRVQGDATGDEEENHGHAP